MIIRGTRFNQQPFKCQADSLNIQQKVLRAIFWTGTCLRGFKHPNNTGVALSSISKNCWDIATLQLITRLPGWMSQRITQKLCKMPHRGYYSTLPNPPMLSTLGCEHISIKSIKWHQNRSTDCFRHNLRPFYYVLDRWMRACLLLLHPQPANIKRSSFVYENWDFKENVSCMKWTKTPIHRRTLVI